MTTISTVAELKTAIQSEMLDRSDLSTKLDGFIQKAEMTFNKLLRTWHQEEDTTLTIDADGYAPLPEDYQAWRAVWVDGSPRIDLKPISPHGMIQLYPISTNGLGKHFTVTKKTPTYSDLVMRFEPRPTGTINLLYHQKLTPLEEGTTDTNWLLDEDPDCYLATCCYYAARHLRNADDMALFKAEYQERIALLNKADRDARWQQSVKRALGSVRP